MTFPGNMCCSEVALEPAARATSSTAATPRASPEEPATEETPEQILAKRVKALKKKLKAIDQLQAEVDAGKVAAPSKDQLEKLARRAELAAELAELESGS